VNPCIHGPHWPCILPLLEMQGSFGRGFLGKIWWFLLYMRIGAYVGHIGSVCPPLHTGCPVPTRDPRAAGPFPGMTGPRSRAGSQLDTQVIRWVRFLHLSYQIQLNNSSGKGEGAGMERGEGITALDLKHAGIVKPCKNGRENLLNFTIAWFQLWIYIHQPSCTYLIK